VFYNITIYLIFICAWFIGSVVLVKECYRHLIAKKLNKLPHPKFTLTVTESLSKVQTQSFIR